LGGGGVLGRGFGVGWGGGGGVGGGGGGEGGGGFIWGGGGGVFFFLGWLGGGVFCCWWVWGGGWVFFFFCGSLFFFGGGGGRGGVVLGGGLCFCVGVLGGGWGGGGWGGLLVFGGGGWCFGLGGLLFLFLWVGAWGVGGGLVWGGFVSGFCFCWGGGVWLGWGGVFRGVFLFLVWVGPKTKKWLFFPKTHPPPTPQTTPPPPPQNKKPPPTNPPTPTPTNTNKTYPTPQTNKTTNTPKKKTPPPFFLPAVSRFIPLFIPPARQSNTAWRAPHETFSRIVPFHCCFPPTTESAFLCSFLFPVFLIFHFFPSCTRQQLFPLLPFIRTFLWAVFFPPLFFGPLHFQSNRPAWRRMREFTECIENFFSLFPRPLGNELVFLPPLRLIPLSTTLLGCKVSRFGVFFVVKFFSFLVPRRSSIRESTLFQPPGRTLSAPFCVLFSGFF